MKWLWERHCISLYKSFPLNVFTEMTILWVWSWGWCASDEPPEWPLSGKLCNRRISLLTGYQNYHSLWEGSHLLLVFLASLGNFWLMDLAFFHKIKFSKLFSFFLRYYSQLNRVNARHSVKHVLNSRQRERSQVRLWRNRTDPLVFPSHGVTIHPDGWVCAPETLTSCTRPFAFDRDII